MTTWNFLIPRLAGSPWDKPGALYSTDLGWPTVGIYCPHDPAPWLLGSFAVSPEVLEQRQEVYWGWRRDFVTGDGHLIRLGRNSTRGATQSLVGNDLHDAEALQRAFTRALEEHGPLAPETTEVMAKLEASDRDLRQRIPLECGTCRLSRVFRSDTIQKVLTTFWQAGIREVPLATFATRIDRRGGA